MARIIGIILPSYLPIGTSKIIGTISIPKVTTGVKLPMSLPTSIGKYSVEGGNIQPSRSPLKISMVEKSNQINSITAPMAEKSWDFKGLVLTETIVDYMSTSFLIYEDIRARILTDVYMIDKNHICINWYGQEVDEVMILRKSRLDDEYQVIDTVAWGTEKYILEVSEDATNVKLEGVGATGESSDILLEDGFETRVKTDIEIALNIKVHYLEIDRESTYRLKINY